MSRLSRITQKIFGSANTTSIGVFGSLAAGTPTVSTDIATIQGGTAWNEGWDSATVTGLNLPAYPEMTGVDKVVTQQIAYLFQEGIPEWDSGPTYYLTGCYIVKKTGTTQLYKTLIDNNIGNALPSGVSDSNWGYLGDLSNLNSGLSSTLTSAYLFVGNGSNIATGVAMSGDATLANTGAISLANTSTARKNIGIGKIINKSIFTSSGTFTTSANITTTTVFKVTITGGGGAGGAGATAIKYFTGLSPSTGYSVTIGAGSTSTGGNSTIVVGATTVTAAGGGTTNGGTATNGDININGGDVFNTSISNFSIGGASFWGGGAVQGGNKGAYGSGGGTGSPSGVDGICLIEWSE